MHTKSESHQPLAHLSGTITHQLIDLRVPLINSLYTDSGMLVHTLDACDDILRDLCRGYCESYFSQQRCLLEPELHQDACALHALSRIVTELGELHFTEATAEGSSAPCNTVGETSSATRLSESVNILGRPNGDTRCMQHQQTLIVDIENNKYQGCAVCRPASDSHLLNFPLYFTRAIALVCSSWVLASTSLLVSLSPQIKSGSRLLFRFTEHKEELPLFGHSGLVKVSIQ